MDEVQSYEQNNINDYNENDDQGSGSDPFRGWEEKEKVEEVAGGKHQPETNVLTTLVNNEPLLYILMARLC